jgi:hypothetical protein
MYYSTCSIFITPNHNPFKTSKIHTYDFIAIILKIKSPKSEQTEILIRERDALTSVLAGDEIDPLAELDLDITVAHEVLQSDPPDCACARTTKRGAKGARESPRIRHSWIERSVSLRTLKERESV